MALQSETFLANLSRPVLRLPLRPFVCLLIGGAVSLAPTGARSTPSTAPNAASALRLGKVDFPTSGSPAAQPHFQRGVAALHSFWYDEAFDAAIAALRRATALEEDLGRPPGPPAAYKPPHELLGEILLRAGQPADAAVQFRKNLVRHPNRALSLIGCARAEAAMGDKSAALASYTRFLGIWNQADKDLAELREARNYVQANQG